MAANPRVIVVDDDRLARECLVAQLAANGIDAGPAWDLPSLLSAVDAAPPTAVLIHVETPDSNTLIQVSMDVHVGTKVIVYGLSADRESEIVSSAEAGVAGLHLRSESFEHLLTLARNADRGQSQCSPEVSAILLRRVYAIAGQQHPESSRADSLTARESEILELLDQGLTNQQIASRLSVTLHTVKNHVHSLLGKLSVGSRAEAVAVFRAAKFSNPG